jgi:hypothetical protein
MSWDFEDAAEQKKRVQREIAKRLKRGEVMEILEAPQGSKKLATTFWGKAWCDHLATYAEHEHRLPRGRSYLRQGNVYNLRIEPGLVSAVVAGSELYETKVHIRPLEKEAWVERGWSWWRSVRGRWGRCWTCWRGSWGRAFWRC